MDQEKEEKEKEAKEKVEKEVPQVEHWTVGIGAMKWMVHVIGVGMLNCVVGKDGLEMDVMAPLVVQININVYWIQVQIFFLVLEQKIYKNKNQTAQ